MTGAMAGIFGGILCWLAAAELLYDDISIFSTGQSITLLLGNIVSISLSGVICTIGSILKPDNFDFSIMKQRIVVVDEKIRSIIEKDSDDRILRGIAKFSYKYAIAISIILVIVWPLPLYFSGYVFSLDVYVIWVGISIIWAIGGALVIVFQPLIEARSTIVKVVRNMLYHSQLDQNRIPKDNVAGTKTYANDGTRGYAQSSFDRIILVAVDGSLNSLRALNHAIQMYDKISGIKILVLNVIEWTNDAEDSIDDELAMKIEEKGRRMLSSILIKNDIYKCERIVKLGDPVNKIVEVAEKNHAEMIILGARGLGSTALNLGSISSKVVGRTSIPVLLIN